MEEKKKKNVKNLTLIPSGNAENLSAKTSTSFFTCPVGLQTIAQIHSLSSGDGEVYGEFMNNECKKYCAFIRYSHRVKIEGKARCPFRELTKNLAVKIEKKKKEDT